MIRFALIVASTLGFVLTAALGNLMTPLLRAFRVRQEENEPPTMGGLCLMVGTLAAVGVGWTAACVAQPELLGTESLLTTRLLIALFGALCFGAVGLADDLVRLRHRSPLGLRRPVRLALEAASGTLVLALLGLNHCLPDGLALPGVGYCTLGPLAPVVWLAILVALAESARTADGMDGTVCGCAFIAMLGLMTAMTLLGWFPLGVLPAAEGRHGCGGRLHRTPESACRWPAGQEMQGHSLQISRQSRHFRAGPELQTLQPAASCSLPYRSG